MQDTRRLYQQIADRVRLLIQEGKYGSGSRLPAERELAQQLGVSRPSLREALIALEIGGAIEIRMGSGIYVLSLGKAAPSAPALGESPTELMEARATIESAVIVQAAGVITDATLADLREVLASMRTEIEEREGYVSREGVVDLDAINRDLVECHSQVLWKRPKAYLEILAGIERSMSKFFVKLGEERRNLEMRQLHSSMLARLDFYRIKLQGIDSYAHVTLARLDIQRSAVST